MVYKIIADIVVLIHFFWILFLFLGAIWGRKNKFLKVFHISGLFFAFLIQIFDWYCPLTHLEVWLRSKHSPALTYAGSFIIHYIEQIVYIEIAFTTSLSAHAWLYLGRRRSRQGRAER